MSFNFEGCVGQGWIIDSILGNKSRLIWFHHTIHESLPCRIDQNRKQAKLWGNFESFRRQDDGKWRVFSWCRRTPPLRGQMFPSALICRRDRSSGLDLYPPNEPHHLLKSQCNADEHAFCLWRMSDTRALGKFEKKRKFPKKISGRNPIWKFDSY